MVYGEAEDGSVGTSQWLRREHAAYMATPLVALDALSNTNITSRSTLEMSLRGQTGGSVWVGSQWDSRKKRKK